MLAWKHKSSSKSNLDFLLFRKCLENGGCIFEHVKVQVLVVGCKLDLLDEQDKVQLKHLISKVMGENPEI